MRKRTIAGRMAAAGLAASVAALGTTAVASSAATTGVGTGTVSTSVLDAALGDLLGMTLLEDVAASNTDPKVGPAGASSVLRQLKLSSSIDALNRVVGEHRVSAPQGPTDITTSLLDLGSLGLGAVVDGTIEPIVLKALSTPSSATASSARITDLGLLGGLANLGVLRATDQTGSGSAAAEAGRAMSLDALGVLDLGMLLQGLGLDILNLPISIVSDLLGSLGIPFNLQGASDLESLVTSLGASIESLATSGLPAVTQPILEVIGGLGLPVALQPVIDTTITTAVSTLVNTLTSLISSVTDLLESATLLKLNALDITTQAKATSSAADSTATATGTLGGLQIGGLSLPGLDLAAATAAVNNLLAQIQSALGGILAPLGLADLLSVRLFDRQTGITQAGGVVKAVSSITGLVVKLTPPSLGTLGALNQPGSGLGSLLPGASPRAAASGSVTAAAASPVVAAAAPNPLAGLLGITSVLSKGLELRVGTVQSQSLHAVPAAVPGPPAAPVAPGAPVPATTSTPGSLPRTGGEQTTLALLAIGLGAAALGARRLRRELSS